MLEVHIASISFIYFILKINEKCLQFKCYNRQNIHKQIYFVSTIHQMIEGRDCLSLISGDKHCEWKIRKCVSEQTFVMINMLF